MAFVNIARIRERILESVEQILTEEGLEGKATLDIKTAPQGRAVHIEVVEQLNKQPKEIVN